MFFVTWFQSSEEKRLRSSLTERINHCITDISRYESGYRFLNGYIQQSNEIAIIMIVDRCKATIKDATIPPSQKYQALQLLKDLMRSKNKALGQYVVTKILKRLTILAAHNKGRFRDDNRGKDIFGNVSPQEAQYSCKFLPLLLGCIEDWAKTWPKSINGTQQAFKQSYVKLLSDKVTFPKKVDKQLPEQQAADKNMVYFRETHESLTLMNALLKDTALDDWQTVRDIANSIINNSSEGQNLVKIHQTTPSSESESILQLLKQIFEYLSVLRKDTKSLEKDRSQFEVYKKKHFVKTTKLIKNIYEIMNRPPAASAKTISKPAIGLEHPMTDNRYDSTNNIKAQLEQYNRELNGQNKVDFEQSNHEDKPQESRSHMSESENSIHSSQNGRDNDKKRSNAPEKTAKERTAKDTVALKLQKGISSRNIEKNTHQENIKEGESIKNANGFTQNKEMAPKANNLQPKLNSQASISEAGMQRSTHSQQSQNTIDRGEDMSRSNMTSTDGSNKEIQRQDSVNFFDRIEMQTNNLDSLKKRKRKEGPDSKQPQNEMFVNNINSKVDLSSMSVFFRPAQEGRNSESSIGSNPFEDPNERSAPANFQFESKVAAPAAFKKKNINSVFDSLSELTQNQPQISATHSMEGIGSKHEIKQMESVLVVQTNPNIPKSTNSFCSDEDKSHASNPFDAQTVRANAFDAQTIRANPFDQQSVRVPNPFESNVLGHKAPRAIADPRLQISTNPFDSQVERSNCNLSALQPVVKGGEDNNGNSFIHRNDDFSVIKGPHNRPEFPSGRGITSENSFEDDDKKHSRKVVDISQRKSFRQVDFKGGKINIAENPFDDPAFRSQNGIQNTNQRLNFPPINQRSDADTSDNGLGFSQFGEYQTSQLETFQQFRQSSIKQSQRSPKHQENNQQSILKNFDDIVPQTQRGSHKQIKENPFPSILKPTSLNGVIEQANPFDSSNSQNFQTNVNEPFQEKFSAISKRKGVDTPGNQARMKNLVRFSTIENLANQPDQPMGFSQTKRFDPWKGPSDKQVKVQPNQKKNHRNSQIPQQNRSSTQEDPEPLGFSAFGSIGSKVNQSVASQKQLGFSAFGEMSQQQGETSQNGQNLGLSAFGTFSRAANDSVASKKDNQIGFSAFGRISPQVEDSVVSRAVNPVQQLKRQSQERRNSNSSIVRPLGFSAFGSNSPNRNQSVVSKNGQELNFSAFGQVQNTEINQSGALGFSAFGNMQSQGDSIVSKNPNALGFSAFGPAIVQANNSAEASPDRIGFSMFGSYREPTNQSHVSEKNEALEFSAFGSALQNGESSIMSTKKTPQGFQNFNSQTPNRISQKGYDQALPRQSVNLNFSDFQAPNQNSTMLGKSRDNGLDFDAFISIQKSSILKSSEIGINSNNSQKEPRQSYSPPPRHQRPTSIEQIEKSINFSDFGAQSLSVVKPTPSQVYIAATPGNTPKAVAGQTSKTLIPQQMGLNLSDFREPNQTTQKIASQSLQQGSQNMHWSQFASVNVIQQSQSVIETPIKSKNAAVTFITYNAHQEEVLDPFDKRILYQASERKGVNMVKEQRVAPDAIIKRFISPTEANSSIGEELLQEKRKQLALKAALFRHKREIHAHLKEEFHKSRQFYLSKIGTLDQIIRQQEMVVLEKDRAEEVVFQRQRELSQAKERLQSMTAIRNEIIINEKRLYMLSKTTKGTQKGDSALDKLSLQSAPAKPAVEKTMLNKWQLFNRNLQQFRNHTTSMHSAD